MTSSPAPDFSQIRAECVLTYARSSGSGGQNVNKVNSKVLLRWSPSRSAAMPPEVLNRFNARFGRRLNREGELLITAEEHRDQGRNASRCFEKLEEMILSVWRRPRPRIATKPTRGSKERRLLGKRVLSEKKSNRRKLD